MKLKLTSSVCREAKCPEGQRKIVLRDTEVIGFGLEVRSSGLGTYYLYYQDESGILKQHRIGKYNDITFEQAKTEAKRLRSQVVLGGNPGADRAQRRAVGTFGELSALHIEHAQGTLRSHSSVELAHRRYLIPRFGRCRIDAITSQDIDRYFAELRKRLAPATIDRLRLVMHRAYKLAAAWNLPGAERNPVATVTRPRYSNQRSCLLSPEEVDRLLSACGRSSNVLLKPMVQLLLATAARRGELLSAKVEHIDFDRGEWFLPMTKNGHSRRVPLSKAALAVIEQLPRPAGCPWLLANPKTGNRFDNFKRAWATACKAAGLPGLRVHDLRHAAISAMINQGVSLQVAGAVAGHRSVASTARYAHVADRTLAAAVEAGAANLNL